LLYGVTDADDGVSGVEIELSVDDGEANDVAEEEVAQAVRELLSPAVEESRHWKADNSGYPPQHKDTGGSTDE